LGAGVVLGGGLGRDTTWKKKSTCGAVDTRGGKTKEPVKNGLKTAVSTTTATLRITYYVRVSQPTSALSVVERFPLPAASTRHLK
jgi:hypothetical protein